MNVIVFSNQSYAFIGVSVISLYQILLTCFSADFLCQNGSCVIGPLIRLFDETFSIDDVKKAEVHITISGEDGFFTEAISSMSKISRSPEDLVSQVINNNHQYHVIVSKK